MRALCRQIGWGAGVMASEGHRGEDVECVGSEIMAKEGP